MKTPLQLFSYVTGMCYIRCYMSLEVVRHFNLTCMNKLVFNGNGRELATAAWLARHGDLAYQFIFVIGTGLYLAVRRGGSRARPWIRFWNRTIVLAVRQLYRQRRAAQSPQSSKTEDAISSVISRTTQRNAQQARRIKHARKTRASAKQGHARQTGKADAKQERQMQGESSQVKQDAKTPRQKTKQARQKTKQGPRQGKPTAFCLLPWRSVCSQARARPRARTRNKSKSKKSKRKSKGKEEAHLDFRLVWAFLPWRSVCFSLPLCVGSSLSNKRESKSKDRKDKTNCDFRCVWVLPSWRSVCSSFLSFCGFVCQARSVDFDRSFCGLRSPVARNQHWCYRVLTCILRCSFLLNKQGHLAGIDIHWYSTTRPFRWHWYSLIFNPRGQLQLRLQSTLIFTFRHWSSHYWYEVNSRLEDAIDHNCDSAAKQQRYSSYSSW